MGQTLALRLGICDSTWEHFVCVYTFQVNLFLSDPLRKIWKELLGTGEFWGVLRWPQVRVMINRGDALPA